MRTTSTWNYVLQSKKTIRNSKEKLPHPKLSFRHPIFSLLSLWFHFCLTIPSLNRFERIPFLSSTTQIKNTQVKTIYHLHIETNLSIISQINTYTIMHLFDFADSWAASPQMKFAPEKPKSETTRSRAQFSPDDHGQQRRRPSESLLLVENPVFALQNEMAFWHKIFSIRLCMSFIALSVFCYIPLI